MIQFPTRKPIHGAYWVRVLDVEDLTAGQRCPDGEKNGLLMMGPWVKRQINKENAEST